MTNNNPSIPTWFNENNDQTHNNNDRNLFLESKPTLELPPPPKPTNNKEEPDEPNANWWERDSLVSTDNMSLMIDNEMLGDKERKTRKQEIEAEYPDPSKTTRPYRGRRHRNSRRIESKKEKPKAFGVAEEEDKNDAKKEEDEKPRIVILEAKSPAIWTYGCMVLILLVFFGECIQQKWIDSMNSNPLIGPSSDNVVILGAKYGPSILDGEIWRFITAIFLHLGLVQLVFSEGLLFVTLPVEIDGGYWRCFFIFFIAGTYGWILSSLFSPNMIGAGTSGAVLGLMMVMMCDLITSWKTAEKKGFKLGKMIVCIAACIIFGLLPFMDNFSHIGGIIVGILCSIMILPNMTMSRASTICHGLTAFLAFPILTIIYSATLVGFYRAADTTTGLCPACRVINCINIKNWCTGYGTNTVSVSYWPPD